MSSGRSAKRARKKEWRNTRREQWRRAVAKRRRQRWGIVLGSLGVAGLGLLIVLLATNGSEKRPAATPTAGPPDEITAPVKEPVACGAKLPKAAGSKKKQYEKATNQHLDPERVYLLKLETSCGDVVIRLDTKRAPKTANSIAFLAREGFYDGLVFHRVVPGFVVQGGDPQANGQGGAGYSVVEAPPDDLKYEKGIVAMAKADGEAPGTSGSQFFIVSGSDGASLTPEFALVGEVVEGMDVIAKIEESPGGNPGEPPPSTFAYIERATISIELGARQ